MISLTDLSDKQRQILAMLAEGKRIKQIHDVVEEGPLRGKSMSATKNAMRSIYRLIGVSNSNAAVAWYVIQLHKHSHQETALQLEGSQKTL